MKKFILGCVAAAGLVAPAQAQVAVGWHTSNPVNCGWFNDSAGGQDFFVNFADGEFLFTSNNVFVDIGLQIPCDSGNALAWHVINPSGAFDETVSFPHR